MASRAQVRQAKGHGRSIRDNPDGRRLLSVTRTGTGPRNIHLDRPAPLPAEPNFDIGNPISNDAPESLGAYLERIRPAYERRVKELRRAP